MIAIGAPTANSQPMRPFDKFSKEEPKKDVPKARLGVDRPFQKL